MIKTRKNNRYLSFQEAREFAQSMNFRKSKEWKEYTKAGKNPQNIPCHPDIIYKEQGWDGWKDFLGNAFVSLEEAKKYAHSLKLKNYREWRKYILSHQIPENIPISPDHVYINRGWISWADFLGTRNIASSKRIFLPFKEARIFVRNLKLNSLEEWKQYCKTGKKPEDIPAGPHKYYTEWTHWRNFLGTEQTHNDRHLSFVKARKYVRNLKLNNYKEWKEYLKSGKKPIFLPSSPDAKYKNKGWVSFGDFLGTFTIGNRYMHFRPFLQARKYVRSLKIEKYTEWKKYCKSGKKPHDIPCSPHNVYQDKGWNGYRDFLGIK